MSCLLFSDEKLCPPVELCWLCVLNDPSSVAKRQIMSWQHALNMICLNVYAGRNSVALKHPLTNLYPEFLCVKTQIL